MDLTTLRTLLDRQRCSGRDPIDLATGALLLEQSTGTRRAVRAVRLRAPAYTPSAGAFDTRERLAAILSEQFGRELPADCVALVAGATEGVLLAMMTLQPQGVWVHAQPGWHTFGPIARMAGAQVRPWNYRTQGLGEVLSREPAGAHPLGIFFGSPVNPTGDLLPLDELPDPGPGVRHLYDLTYLGMTVEDRSDYFHALVQKGLSALDHACLVFSLSKLFRVPGLRLGFVVSSPELIARLSTTKSAVSLNMPYDLQQLAVALWPRCQEEIGEVRGYLGERSEWLSEQCARRGLAPIRGAGTHYRVVELGEPFDEKFSALMREGIFLAPCEDLGMPGWARFNVSCGDGDICRFLDHFAGLRTPHQADA